MSETIVSLRASGQDAENWQERAFVALKRVGEIWEKRLQENWTPPEASAFSWAQVRVSLAALVPGLKAPSSPVGGERKQKAKVIALILAGNTPLMSWSPLCACLLAGHAVFVKMSRDETLWPRLFVESLAEVDAELASRIHLDVWPGDDDRTTELVRSVDAVIGFGEDATIEALRQRTPKEIPFYGFGHGVSMGVCTAGGVKHAGDFAPDILLYGQGGCLSAQAILVDDHNSGQVVTEAAERLRIGLEATVDTLEIPPITDPAVANAVRSARDMALFSPRVRLLTDSALRWTILVNNKRAKIDFPIGHGVVQMMAFSFAEGTLTSQLGAVRGILSSVGVAGTLTPAMEEQIRTLGVSRICKAGEMQAPPLDWSNGNIDLLTELLKI